MTVSSHPRVKLFAAGVAVFLAMTACSSPDNTQHTSTAAVVTSGGKATDVTLASLEKKVDLSQCDKPTRSIKHDLGTTSITGKPVRVVALELSFADALANVGINPVGIADDGKATKVSGLQDNIGDYTSLGLRSAPNISVISSLKPDLIVADTTRDKAIYGQLSSIAPTISLTSIGAGYGDTLAVDLRISEAVGRCPAMKAALTKHFATMTSIAAKAPKGEKRTFVYADVLPPDFNAHSGNQWEPQILATLGLRSVLPPKPGSRSLTLSLEQMFSHNPDVMFLGVDDQKNVIDQWKSSPVYKQISAVKNKAVYEVDDTLWSSERGIRTSEIVLQQAIDKLAGTGQ